MDEYLIITGINTTVNPGNNAFNMTPTVSLVLVRPYPFLVKAVTFYVDRFVFRTNGEHTAKIDLYTFLN